MCACMRARVCVYVCVFFLFLCVCVCGLKILPCGVHRTIRHNKWPYSVKFEWYREEIRLVGYTEE